MERHPGTATEGAAIAACIAIVYWLVITLALIGAIGFLAFIVSTALAWRADRRREQRNA